MQFHKNMILLKSVAAVSNLAFFGIVSACGKSNSSKNDNPSNVSPPPEEKKNDPEGGNKDDPNKPPPLNSYGLTGGLNINLTLPNVTAPKVFADNTLGLKGKPSSTPNVASKFAQAAPGPMANSLSPAFVSQQQELTESVRKVFSFDTCVTPPTGFNDADRNGATVDTYPPSGGGVRDPLVELWDRFFDGCGPTDVFKTMKEASTQLSGLLTRINAGGARCLSMPTKEFGNISFPGITSSDTGAAVHLSCVDARDNEKTAVAYGLKDGYFYFAEGSYPTKTTERRGVGIIRIKQDGSEIDLWRPIGTGDSNMSTGLAHLKAKIGPTPEESGFSMTGVGRNIGPGCGFFIKSKGDYLHLATLTAMVGQGDLCQAVLPGSSAVSTDNPATTGTNEEWESFKTKATPANLFCLKKSSSNANNFELLSAPAATSCGGAGDYNPATDAKLLHYTAYPDTLDANGKSYLSSNTFGAELFAANSTILSLTSWLTQDPVFVIRERLFSGGPTNVPDILASARTVVETKLKPFFAQEKLPQCALEKPTTLDTKTEKNGKIFDFNLPISLSCQGDQGILLGSVGRADTFFANLDDGGSTLKILRQSADGSLSGIHSRVETGKINNTEWSEGTGMLLSYLIDTKTETTEYTIVGSSGTGIGCGVHAKVKGNLIYIQGRFSDQNCQTTADDADCIQIDATEFQRKPIGTCFDAGLLSFQLTSLTRENFTPDMRAPLYDRVNSLKTALQKSDVAFDVQKNPSGVEETKEITDGSSPTLPLRAEAAEFTATEDSFLESFFATPRNTTSMPPAAANCLHTNGVDDVENIEGVATLALSRLDDTKFKKLADAAKVGTAYLGYRYDVSIFTMGGGEVSQNVTADFILKSEDGTIKKKVTQSNYGNSTGYYTIGSLLKGATIAKTDAIDIKVSGTLRAKCLGSAANGRQMSIRVGMRQFQLNY